MEKSTIKKFIEILPVKYFFFEIQDEEIVNVYFYFKLAKICFLEIILKRIYFLYDYDWGMKIRIGQNLFYFLF